MRGRRDAGAVTVALAVVLAGCAGGGPRISRSTDPPATPTASAPPRPTPSPTSSPPPSSTSPFPLADPARLDFGRLLPSRAVTATVTVRPGRRTVRLGATELRGSPAYDVTGDTCSGRVLTADSGGCRIEVTVLTRATGEVSARLVLPTGTGSRPLVVPLTGTVPLSYTVSLTVLGAGAVTVEGYDLSCSDSCTARIPQGAALTLTASSAARWGGACAAAGSAPTCRVTVGGPLQISVDFRPG